MPTLPDPVSHPADRPHRDRDLARSFGADADRYDRSRPHYPQVMVERIVAASPGRHVLDVGIGTGIAARQFRAAGCAVLGVDPDPRMADVARRAGLDVEVAAFEAWDPGGRTFDAVVAGQAWHWIDPVAGAAKAAEALPPGGRLAVFWNVDRPPLDVTEPFAAVYRRLMPDSLVGRRWTTAAEGPNMLCTRAAGGIREAGGFTEPEQWSFDWERSYTRDEWLDQLPTQGDHYRYPEATVAELLAGIGAAIDALGGSFVLRSSALVVTAVRRDAA